MTKLLTSMALAAMVAVGLAQTTQTTVVHTPDGDVVAFVNNNNLTYEDAAADFAIARALNMDPAAVMAMRGDINAPFYQLAPAYVISQQSGQPLSSIWDMYNNGMTWMQIANQYNVPASYYNPLNVDTSAYSNDQFTTGVWEDILQNNYAMTPDDFTYYTTNNVPLNEVVVGDVLARQDNMSARDVINAYNANHDWVAFQNNYANNITPMDTTSSSTTTTTTTTTTPVTPVEPTGSETTTTVDYLHAAHHTQTAPADPIQEWQLNGGGIKAHKTRYPVSSSPIRMPRPRPPPPGRHQPRYPK